MGLKKPIHKHPRISNPKQPKRSLKKRQSSKTPKKTTNFQFPIFIQKYIKIFFFVELDDPGGN